MFKDRLTSTSVLTLPEGIKNFGVYCDSSRVGLGCVLIQHGKVIAYAYRKLKVHKKNYPTHYIQLAALVFAFNIWRHFFYGVHVEIFTDQNTLQYMFTEKELNFLQIRWLELLKDYEISVIYYPYTANIVAEAQSCLIMASISHLDEAKKDLAWEVYKFSRVGVRL